CGQSPEGARARGPAGTAADAIRLHHQPEDGPGAGAHHPPARAVAGHRGHSIMNVSRRQFVQGMGVAGLGLVAGCGRLPGHPQAPSVARVGYLGPTNASHPYFESFRQGMRELGYVEDQNLVIEGRWAEGRPERYSALAAELASSSVDVIVVGAPTPAVLAVKDATSTIPIVMTAVSDPVAVGLVSSLARPEGNVTGLSDL